MSDHGTTVAGTEADARVQIEGLSTLAKRSMAEADQLRAIIHDAREFIGAPGKVTKGIAEILDRALTEQEDTDG